MKPHLSTGSRVLHGAGVAVVAVQVGAAGGERVRGDVPALARGVAERVLARVGAEAGREARVARGRRALAQAAASVTAAAAAARCARARWDPRGRWRQGACSFVVDAPR